MDKKAILVGLVVASALLIAGCSQAEPTEVPEPTESVAQPAVATDTPPVATEVPNTPTPEPSAPVWEADGVVGENEYSDSLEVAGVQFLWSHDGEYLYAAVTSKVTGWVSLGFDPENRMQGANFILGYVAEGNSVIFDMYGVAPVGRNSHPPDEELGGTNDIVEFGGVEVDGSTTLEFKIPLDSGDQYDKPLVPGETYAVIAAAGRSDDADSPHATIFPIQFLGTSASLLRIIT